MIPPKFFPLSVLLLSGVSATGAFALGGAAKNSAGYAVPGASVFFASDTSAKQTTDGRGAFTLNAPGVSVRPGVSPAQDAERLVIREGRLRFVLASPVREGFVEAYSLDGVKRFETSPAPMNAGAHQVDLSRLASGLYSLRLRLDGRTLTRSFAQVGRAGSSIAFTGALRTAGTAAALDTLIVRKNGYLVEKVAVTSYGQADLAVSLRADTAAALPAVTDYSVDGPFATVVQAGVGPGQNYTIVRPETLGANGFLHAPIIYGHGINGQVSNFTNFLRSVASHGFVIIARNVLTGGPNDAGNVTALNTGLNWILAQDTTTGSIYRGKLATDRAASMGYSVGGTAAVNIGAHLALKTVVSIHGHTSTATLRGTLLQTSGTLDTVGRPLQVQTFNNSVVPTFFGTVTGANHTYIERNNGGAERPAIVAWLRLRLYNDAGARGNFYGSDCTLCKAPWENPQRKNWE